MPVSVNYDLTYFLCRICQILASMRFVYPNLSPFTAYTGLMCGRYRRKSDMQRIAEMFQVEVGLDDLP
jgi:hypothetical protein